MLKEIKEIKEAIKERTIINPQVIREILRVLLNGEAPVISEKEYLEAMNGHSSYLIKAAELIRRELLLIAILASNYYDNVGRKLIDLKAVIFFLMPILNANVKQRISEIL